MNTLALTIFLTLMSCTLYSQDLTGQWNGALTVQGDQIRVVFHINKSNSEYDATMDSPDQNVTGMKVTSVNSSYPNVRFEVPSIGAVYEGTLSDKGITGKWVQSGTALFLILSKSGDSPEKGK